jgi:alginate O-acetyltransferase complex protein AlgI
LSKKVILADNFAPLANRVFDGAAHGDLPMIERAWFGVLAYALQLYFDFSGYSDMAIGLSRIFNVKLPLNFNSPYKAPDIIEFWRRWHMTLSTFLREYLYIPLGGNKKGTVRRYANLMITMLLGGMWHGAGWNYILWGGLHGFYLMINHLWRSFVKVEASEKSKVMYVFGALITFFAVMVAWVPFRAVNMETTMNIWRGMVGVNGTEGDSTTLGLYIIGLLIVWVMPNTQEWMGRYSPAWDEVAVRSRFAWRPARVFAVLTGVLFALSVVYFKKNSQFLYFQF